MTTGNAVCWCVVFANVLCMYVLTVMSWLLMMSEMSICDHESMTFKELSVGSHHLPGMYWLKNYVFVRLDFWLCIV